MQPLVLNNWIWATPLIGFYYKQMWLQGNVCGFLFVCFVLTNQPCASPEAGPQAVRVTYLGQHVSAETGQPHGAPQSGPMARASAFAPGRSLPKKPG